MRDQYIIFQYICKSLFISLKYHITSSWTIFLHECGKYIFVFYGSIEIKKKTFRIWWQVVELEVKSKTSWQLYWGAVCLSQYILNIQIHMICRWAFPRRPQLVHTTYIISAPKTAFTRCKLNETPLSFVSNYYCARDESASLFGSSGLRELPICKTAKSWRPQSEDWRKRRRLINQSWATIN